MKREKVITCVSINNKPNLAHTLHVIATTVYYTRPFEDRSCEFIFAYVPTTFLLKDTQNHNARLSNATTANVALVEGDNFTLDRRRRVSGCHFLNARGFPLRSCYKWPLQVGRRCCLQCLFSFNTHLSFAALI